jgi:transglutaminase-like putative cysteine protease
MQDARRAAERTDPVADPLSAIGDRLVSGDRVAFQVRTAAPVDRWPLVVLDRFDGVDWTSGAEVRILGAELPPPALTVPVDTAEAEISGLALDGPWLPSQARLRGVDDLRALVAPATGVLLLPDDTPAPASYRLRWADLRIDRDQLTGATIDPDPVGAVALAAVPAGVADLARTALGPDVGPSVQAALVLERWMRDTYTVAEGVDIPTGHGYPQLLHFLNTSRRGTSEQFATAYAVLARSIGIPTRVVVGFRYDGSGTVRDADVLAWPEIAVSGLGWVPLDPTGGARTGGGTGESLAAATEAARSELPTAGQLAGQTVGAPAPAPSPAAPPAGPPWWIWPLLVLLAVVAVPLAKALRRVRRRRRGPREAVLGAWREVRDALRDQGVPVPPGATVRDLVPRAPVDAAALGELARCVDTVLWSGSAESSGAVAGTAWSAARRVRRELRSRSVRGRLRAGYAVGSFRRPRQVASQSAPRRG